MEVAPENLNKTVPQLKATPKGIIRMVVLAVLIGLVVNLAIAFLMNSGHIFRALERINVFYVLVPFAAYLVIYVIDALRLHIVLWQFNHRIRLVDSLLNTTVGYFLANVTPMASGGQPFQIYHLSTLGVDSKKATNIILSRFVEHMISSIVILLVGFKLALSIAASAGAGSIVIYLGTGVSIFFGFLFLGLLIRPDVIGKIAVFIEHNPVGRLIARLTRRANWSQRLIVWTERLRGEVVFLWGEKFYIMVVDSLLGVVNVLIQAWTLAYVVSGLTGAQVQFIEFFMTFVIVNLVAYYIPTPGGSGSIEGIYSLVFSGITRAPYATFVSVVVWRFATYYLHVFFGLVIFLLFLRRPARSA